MTPPRHVFLSPHPDDVVWSCGASLLRLARAGIRPLVLTVFDGDGPEPPIGWRRIASPSLRRVENDRALAAIGADGISLGMADASLRGCVGHPAYPDPSALFGPIAPADGAVLQVLTSRLEEVLRPPDRVYVPVAGPTAHVDHRILRMAADASAIPSRTYYEDFPYSVQRDASASEPKPSLSDFEQWVSVACLYRSQIVALFGGRERFVAALRAWAWNEASQGTG